MKQLKKNEIIHIKDVSSLPACAASEKEILQSQSIKSLIVLPIYTDKNLLGFIGLDKIKKLQSQIMHQEKIAAIGQIAAGIAHEINNPLGFVNSSPFQTAK